MEVASPPPSSLGRVAGLAAEGVPAPSSGSSTPDPISGARGARLSPQEAHRVIAVIEDSIQKMAFLGSITPDFMQHRGELSRLVGGEIGKAIQDQRMLEQRYEQLIVERCSQRNMANKTRYREIQHEISNVSQSLRESTQKLSHSLRDNPNIAGNIAKIQRDRGELIDLLDRSCFEISERGTYDTLISVIDEDREKEKLKNELIRREQEATASVRALEAQLQEEKDSFETRLAGLQTELAELKEGLRRVRGEMGTDTKMKQKGYSARVASQIRVHVQEQRALESEIEELEKEMAVEQSAHEATVAFLEKKHQQLGSQIDSWEERYTSEHGKMKNELAKLQEERTEMLVVLDHLKGRKAEEIALEEARMEEERRTQEDANVLMEEENRQNDAASAIQRVFKKHLANPNRVTKKKGKGNKGGKKKSKK